MATTKITDLTAYTDPVNTDVLPIVDVTSDVTKKVSIANVMKNASLGSAAAPGIAFDGDPNTGIYSPGANQVAITTDGTQRMLIDSAGAVTIAGDLTVNGTTTNINTQNLVVEDKNIVLGDVTTPTDVTADGGGITLKGATDKTINWVDSTDAWTSSERFSYPTGSAAAPTLTFTGDPNTGIYSPGADQVAISTGGSGRLFVDASGRVGVGGSPSLRLDVAATGDDGIRFSTTGTSNSARLELSSGNGTTSGKYAYIKVQNNDANAQGYAFGTFGDDRWVVRDTKANSERLCITSAGLVGVGVSAPSSILHVNAGAGFDTNVRLQIGAAGSHAKHTYSDATNTVQWTSGYRSSTNTFGINVGDSFNSTGLTIDSSGRCGIGTSSPGQLLDVAGIARFGANATKITTYSDSTYAGFFNGSSLTSNESIYMGAGGTYFYNSGSPSVTITSSGRLGIGTASPGATLDVRGNTNINATNARIYIDNGGVGGSSIQVGVSGTSHGYVGTDGLFPIVFQPNNTERARIDSSGRLLVGTSSSRNGGYADPAQVLIEGLSYNTAAQSIILNSNDGNGASLNFAKSRGTSLNSFTVVQSGDRLGVIDFAGADGSTLRRGAVIEAFVDGTPGSADMPGRLVFSTTADGASSPTERMRITSAGTLRYGQTSVDDPASANISGIAFASTGRTNISTDDLAPLSVNRKTTDGNLVIFLQDGVNEGTISVSGTTVSYNGAHLSRWSQLPSGAERTEILRGSVLSNIDEMCEWGDEENEQLNRMKVSDVEGDKNVAGVFQDWDDDDDTYINDFYCAMTGDFIIRIGAGVTVERGDLLMSAGDGTAKPQDDDIIRSKTIAKVTSTNVSCTYDDGSYCVPCVLMAC